MIYIQTLDRRWSPGAKLLAGEPIAKINAFERYIADIFVEEVKKAIDTQKYSGKWAPLSTRYLKSKVRKGQSPHIWEATSQLKNSLKVYGKSPLVIGWDKRYVHKESRVPLYQIARKLEYGDLQVPPRPLFRYIFEYLSKNIRKFYNKFNKSYITPVQKRLIKHYGKKMNVKSQPMIFALYRLFKKLGGG